MAMGVGDDGDELNEVHEINVTPFIDVMLVLLIIFMVAAPLATVDVKVNLPTSTAPEQPRPDKPVYLTLKADDTLVLNQTPVTRAGLGAALDRLSGGNHEERIFLRADKTVSYAELMTAMDALRDAGYPRVALVAQETPDHDGR